MTSWPGLWAPSRSQPHKPGEGRGGRSNVPMRGKGHCSEGAAGVSARWRAQTFYFAFSLGGGRRDSAQRWSALHLLFSSVVAALRTRGCLLACLWAFNKHACSVLCWQCPRPPVPPFVSSSVARDHRCSASPSHLSGKQSHRGHICALGCAQGCSRRLPAG